MIYFICNRGYDEGVSTTLGHGENVWKMTMELKYGKDTQSEFRLRDTTWKICVVCNISYKRRMETYRENVSIH